jgi:ATP-dependent DNA ligase
MLTRNPFSFEPMLCESAERLPEGREWRYELKLDGFRAIARKSGRRNSQRQVRV